MMEEQQYHKYINNNQIQVCFYMAAQCHGYSLSIFHIKVCVHRYHINFKNNDQKWVNNVYLNEFDSNMGLCIR